MLQPQYIDPSLCPLCANSRHSGAGLREVSLLAAPDKSLLVIIKNGTIHKDIRAAK
jgi:hypothetical protein